MKLYYAYSGSYRSTTKVTLTSQDTSDSLRRAPHMHGNLSLLEIRSRLEKLLPVLLIIFAFQ